MTITDSTTTSTAAFAMVADDLYKDIHKAIRAELFAVTGAAGSADPADATARADVAAYVTSVVGLLESHAHHEDEFVQPYVEQHLPDLAERVAADHVAFDRRQESLLALAQEVTAAGASDQRRLLHLLHLDLAAFTGIYLAHQDLEERVLMPGLDAAIGTEEVSKIHQAIVGSIPPDEMARALAVMLPAINLDDRAELLGGMKAGAPAEVFQGVWGLAGTVLEPADLHALAARLGI